MYVRVQEHIYILLRRWLSIHFHFTHLKGFLYVCFHCYSFVSIKILLYILFVLECWRLTCHVVTETFNTSDRFRPLPYYNYYCFCCRRGWSCRWCLRRTWGQRWRPGLGCPSLATSSPPHYPTTTQPCLVCFVLPSYSHGLKVSCRLFGVMVNCDDDFGVNDTLVASSVSYLHGLHWKRWNNNHVSFTNTFFSKAAKLRPWLSSTLHGTPFLGLSNPSLPAVFTVLFIKCI